MSFCSECGTQVDASSLFCSSCGHRLGPQVATPQTERVTAPSSDTPATVTAPTCQNCGNQVDPKSSFCATCNMEVKPQSKSDAAPRSTFQAPAGRPAGVIILSVLAFFASISSVVLAVFFLLAYFYVTVFGGLLRDIPWVRLLLLFVPWLNDQGNSFENSLMSDIGFGSLKMAALAAVYGLVGYGLWRLRKWGHVLAIGLCVFGLLYAGRSMISSETDVLTMVGDFIIILIEVCILVYLLKSRVRQAFA